MSVYVNPHHYTNMKSIFIQQFLGSSFVSPALGGVGQGRLNINNKIPPKKSGEAPSEVNHAVNKLWWRWAESNRRAKENPRPFYQT